MKKTNNLTIGFYGVFTAVMCLMSGSLLAQPNLPPCGPASQLGSENAVHVDTNARCFELRMYTVDPARINEGDFNGDIEELHQRFREEEVAIFEGHGAEVIGVWQDLQRPNTLIWMLAYRDLEHRAQVWADFAADPAWTALRAKYNVPLQPPEVFYMGNTDYSNLK